MKNDKKLTTYFEVRDYDTFWGNHSKRMKKLENDLNISYDDVINNDTWVTVETETWNRLQDHKKYDAHITRYRVARWINEFTRYAIRGGLGFHKIPESYDSAFYLGHYWLINGNMADILQNFIDRKEVK